MKYVHVHVYLVHVLTMSELLYPLQWGDTPIYLAARGDHTTCVEHLLSTPGIDVNIEKIVSGSTKCLVHDIRTGGREVLCLLMPESYVMFGGQFVYLLCYTLVP